MSERAILLIDDDEDQLAVFTLLLQKEGYKVISTHSAEEGLEVLDREKVDCIVCDVMMPRISGRNVIEAVRKEEKTAKTPIIMITAARDDMVADLITLGANEVCLKREARKELAPLIKGVLEG